MTARIHLLPPQLANQIAAGEVIERPASVIKELLENSLDAQASRIQVDIENGGLRSMKIRDDGTGIEKEDLSLALTSHATSKIRDISDLQQISSLGFRGEALASIAAVSRLSISSMTATEENAWKLDSSNANIMPASHPRGTTVEVRDLFYNTPARRNFLRSEKTEFYHIEETVKRISLSHHNVGFILRHNKRTVFNFLPATEEHEHENKVSQVFGADFIDQAIKLDEQRIGLRLWGWLGSPDTARNQTDKQYFYINGRLVKDKLINHALRQSYQDLLYPGKHPSYLLYLECDPIIVDVNVHPTKHEVRFRDSRLIHEFIFSHCLAKLNADEKVAPITAASTEPAEGSHNHHKQSIQYTSQSKNSHMVKQTLPHEAFYKNTEITHETPDTENTTLGIPRFVLSNKFLLAESTQGLTLIDLRQAQLRIIYGKLIAANANSTLHSQPLLFPETLSLNAKDTEKLLQFTERFTELGIQLQQSGPTTITIRQMPSLLRNIPVKQLFTELLDYLPKGNLDDPATHRELLLYIATFAANIQKNWSPDEMQKLLKELAIYDTKKELANLPKAVKILSLNELEKLVS